MLEASLQRYSLVVVALLAMLLRTAEAQSLQMSQALQTLHMALHRDHDQHLMACVHKVLMLAWTTPNKPTTRNDPQCGTTEKCLALLTLEQSGAFKEPKDVTMIIAKLTHCIRLALLKEVHARAENDQSYDQEVACLTLKRWYTEKNNSPFARLRSLQHRASAISFETMGLPQIWWKDRTSWKSMLYKGDELHLDQVCNMFADMEAKLVDTWENKILGGLPLHDHHEDATISDDLTNKDVGYSFLSDPRNPGFKQRCDRLLRAIVDERGTFKDFLLEREGALTWNQSALRGWLRDYSELQRLLLLRVEMLSGAPGRGTELTAMTYRNTKTRTTRNLVMMGDHLVILCQYLKTTALTGHDKLIPHALDAVTSDVLIQDLTFARPFAEIAASQCFGYDPEIGSLYRNFLFVNFNRLFTTDDISSFMRQSSLPHLSFGLTVSTWRHVQTAWKRKLGCTTEDVIETERSDTIEALQAGHSRATENRLYGLSVQALANTAEDVLPLYLDASITWQRHCKTFPSGSVSCYKQGRSFSFDHTMQSSSTAKESRNVMPKVDDIAQAVADKLLPTLSHLVSSAVDDALAKLHGGNKGKGKGKGRASTPPPEDIHSEKEEARLAVVSERSSRSDSDPRQHGESSKGESLMFSDVLLHIHALVLSATATMFAPPSREPTSARALDGGGMERSALGAMRTLLDEPLATWRSEQQREAMMAVLACKTDVIAVLPTGGGKSMLAIVPSILEDARVTVLIVPLNSLLMDYEHRLQRMNVPFQVFGQQQESLSIMHNLVLVSADRALLPTWRSALLLLSQKKTIARLVFDEAHIPLTASGYRSVLQDIYKLRFLPVQLVLLSATLPPAFIPEVRSSYNLVPDTIVVRQPTDRPELLYTLKKLPGSVGQLQEKAIEIVHAAMDTWARQDRGLIFVNNIPAGLALTAQVNALLYVGDKETMSDAERREAYQTWLQRDYGIMVATTAFSTGNDHPHVRLVIHLDRPFDMVEFVQGQGRAGRDGRPALCCVLVPEQTHKPSGAATSLQNTNRMAMYDHLYTHGLARCLRYGITAFMDGVGIRCRGDATFPERQPCEVCEHDQQVTDLITPPPSHPSVATVPAPVSIHEEDSSKERSNSAFAIAAHQTIHTIKRKEHTIMHRAEMIQRALQSLVGSCSLCAILTVGHTTSGPSLHALYHCPHLAGGGTCSTWNDYLEWRKLLRYSSKHHKKICFMCHVPQLHDSLHPTFIRADQRGQPCEFADIIAPATFGVYHSASLKEQAQRHFGCRWTGLTMFAQWLMGRPKEGTESNLLELFLWCMRCRGQ